jgi:AcrR family transcriptional regulator
MARRVPEHRFADLLDAATRIFISRGYRWTQMADIAAEAGVAKGTVYLYFESKEALFDAVLRHADAGLSPPDSLPLSTPPPGATVEWVRKRVTAEATLPALTDALAQPPVGSAADELEGIVRQFYDKLGHNRTAIRLIDRCAASHPDLAEIWFEFGRRGSLALFTDYIADRAERGLLLAYPEPGIAARLVIETLTYWAVHRHWDVSPQPMSDAMAREHAVRFVLRALLPEPPSGSRRGSQ